MQSDQARNQNSAPPLPRTFIEYVRSFGPGLIIVLTWLGAGDVVDSAVAGGKYGYALMWVIVLAVGMRFVFVSLIAKYQLCNQHGESVLDGLGRVHSWYPPFLAVAAVVMGHVYGSYMAKGAGESWANMTGVGRPWQWAILWSGVALAIVFRPVYVRVERLFLFFLFLLSVAFLGTALWVGPSPMGIIRGTLAFELPESTGLQGSLLVAISITGAILGSLTNLVYPYFLEQKGWRGPQYRRVQLYDFLLGIFVMIVLNLAIWTLGAEVLRPRGIERIEMDDLPRLLSEVLGPAGRLLFYLGIFAAVFTSLVGHALGLALMASHGYERWKAGVGVPLGDYRNTPIYRCVVVWCLVSPLIWSAPGMPGFVTLTLIANSGQVVLIPILFGGVWWITARAGIIGPRYRNRGWENALMAIVFLFALWAANGAVRSVAHEISTLLSGTAPAP